MPLATSAPRMAPDGPCRALLGGACLLGAGWMLQLSGAWRAICAAVARSRGSLVYKVRLPPAEAARARLALSTTAFSGRQSAASAVRKASSRESPTSWQPSRTLFATKGAGRYAVERSGREASGPQSAKLLFGAALYKRGAIHTRAARRRSEPTRNTDSRGRWGQPTPTARPW